MLHVLKGFLGEDLCQSFTTYALRERLDNFKPYGKELPDTAKFCSVCKFPQQQKTNDNEKKVLKQLEDNAYSQEHGKSNSIDEPNRILGLADNRIFSNTLWHRVESIGIFNFIC